jgi:hypothetical protein
MVSPGVKRADPESDQLHLESGLRMTRAVTSLHLCLHDVKRVTLIFREAEKDPGHLGGEEMR